MAEAAVEEPVIPSGFTGELESPPDLIDLIIDLIDLTDLTDDSDSEKEDLNDRPDLLNLQTRDRHWSRNPQERLVQGCSCRYHWEGSARQLLELEDYLDDELVLDDEFDLDDLEELTRATFRSLTKNEINGIPVVVITEDQVSKKLSCPVCLEDFRLDEPASKLGCEHVYHENCIVPWLKFRDTCPICRMRV